MRHAKLALLGLALSSTVTGCSTVSNMIYEEPYPRFSTYGGAKAVAIAIDSEEWPEVLGTIAGDDTILLILKSDGDMPVVECRLSELAGNPC